MIVIKGSKICIINNKNNNNNKTSSFARFARWLSICVHFTTVLVQSTSWNDFAVVWRAWALHNKVYQGRNEVYRIRGQKPEKGRDQGSHTAPGSGITAPGCGITTRGIGISAVFFMESSIMANNKNGFRDQNSHRFWNQGPTFWSKYGIDNERIYLFTTLWIAKNNTKVLFIYTENSEILVGKWNGTYHSIWNSSDIIGYRLNQCFCFSFLTSPLILVHFVIVDRLTMILWFFHFAFGRAAALHVYTQNFLISFGEEPGR